ncbi:MAG: VWA domain-containing protein [Oscillospiraceae bacterium]|nr:VWA domain-containing protein [Oscillospiraceae bacterium]
MSRRKKTPSFRHILSVLLAAAFISTALISPASFTVYADGLGGGPAITGKLADPDTSNAADAFSDIIGENGRLWTDKTVSLASAEDEFLITLSALSQSFSTSTDVLVEPADTVFIIDVSASMYMEKLENGQSRAAAMVEALNAAIRTLMDANLQNRIAVVAYGGDPAQAGSSRSVRILPLGRYDASSGDAHDGQYFYMESAAYIRVNDSIALSAPESRRIRVYGGTPTQRGIYEGAQVLLENTQTTYTEDGVTVIHKPNIVLMTDGGATLAWTDYTFEKKTPNNDNSDWGNANNSDMGIDILTVLTAAYMKQKVHDYYYGAEDTARSVGFYTIGLGVDDSPNAQAALDPGQNAQNNSRAFRGKVYNMKDVLDDFITTNKTEFPALAGGSASTRELVEDIENTTGLTSYDYADAFFNETTADGLNGAFQAVAKKITSTGSYSTEIGENEDANYGGHLVFSDVLGEYMEFKGLEGLWYEDTRYDYGGFEIDDTVVEAVSHHIKEDETIARALLESCTDAEEPKIKKIKYYIDEERKFAGNYFDAAEPGAAVVDLYLFEGEVDDPVTHKPTDLIYMAFQVIKALGEVELICDLNARNRILNTDDQEVRWYIPPSLIPMRSVKPVYDEDGKVEHVVLDEAAPVRAVYAVGLRDGFDLEDVDDTYKTASGAGEDAWYFYTNQWEDENLHNWTMAFFHPNIDNPYYQSPLWMLGQKKASNPTQTDPSLYYGEQSGIGETVQKYYLMNNGRLTVHSDPPKSPSPEEKAKLTLVKEYEGTIDLNKVECDITFVIEGWTDAMMTVSNGFDTFSTSCHDIKDADGSIELEDLPPGYYTVTEYGADETVEEGDLYERFHGVELTAAISGDKTVDVDVNQVGLWLEDGDNVTLTLTNTYTKQPALIVEKKIVGSVKPQGIVFSVWEEVADEPLPLLQLRQYAGYSLFIEDEDQDVFRYVFQGLPPGTYIVTEQDGEPIPGYNGPAVTAKGEPSSSVEVVLEDEDEDGKKVVKVVVDLEGEDVTVVFTNTYTRIPPEEPYDPGPPKKPDDPDPPEEPEEPEEPDDPNPPEEPDDPDPPEEPDDPDPPEEPDDPDPPPAPDDPDPPREPDDPNPPEEPDDPDPPEEPEDPDSPRVDGGTETDPPPEGLPPLPQPPQDPNPQTGGDPDLLPWAAVLAASLLGMWGLRPRRRRVR